MFVFIDLPKYEKELWRINESGPARLKFAGVGHHMKVKKGLYLNVKKTVCMTIKKKVIPIFKL